MKCDIAKQGQLTIWSEVAQTSLRNPKFSIPSEPGNSGVTEVNHIWCREQGEVASQTEDRLLDVLKTVGARVDSAVGTFTNLSSFGRSEQSAVGPHIPTALVR